MTKHDLAEKLNHLDPGSSTEVGADLLAKIFGAGTLTQEVVEEIEAFALEHRCSFLYEASGRHRAIFEKDDIY